MPTAGRPLRPLHKGSPPVGQQAMHAGQPRWVSRGSKGPGTGRLGRRASSASRQDARPQPAGLCAGPALTLLALALLLLLLLLALAAGGGGGPLALVAAVLLVVCGRRQAAHGRPLGVRWGQGTPRNRSLAHRHAAPILLCGPPCLPPPCPARLHTHSAPVPPTRLRLALVGCVPHACSKHISRVLGLVQQGGAIAVVAARTLGCQLCIREGRVRAVHTGSGWGGWRGRGGARCGGRACVATVCA